MSRLAVGYSLDPRFSLIRPLGRGGMAEVWLVRDRELEVEVAAKIVPPGASSETIDLLRRECQNTRRLAHPGIGRVFDFHRGEDRCFVTMAYVEGRNLTHLRGTSPEENVRLLIPVAEALHYAHGRDVIHRDLKPANVIRDADGRPHVVDFGISAVLAAADRQAVAGSGSPCSMSPQQLDGEAPSSADDLYAFGALLHELIDGHPPLWPEITEERIRTVVPAPMRSSFPIPDSLQFLVSRLLAKSVGDRPRDLAEAGAELSSILAGMEREDGEARPVKSKIRLTPPPRVDAVRAVRPTSTSAMEPTDARLDRPAPPRRHGLLAASIIVPLFVVLLLVLFALPRWIAESEEGADSVRPAGEGGEVSETASAQANNEDESAPVVSDGESASKEPAREALERATAFRRRLEERGVMQWAGEEFSAALDSMARADESLSFGAYAEAERGYEEVTRTLESIAGTGPEVLQRAIEDGRRALAAGDGAAAAEAFTLAGTIQPDNGAAATGLRRAATLDELSTLLDEGSRAERAGRIEQARRSFGRATRLDPHSVEARRSLARVQSRVEEDAFGRTMSEGLAALERGDHAAAREALVRAGKLRPDDPAVKEALLQVEQSESLERIAGHRADAVAAEQRERWHAAATSYDAILALDSTIRFAQEGKTRCSARGDLADRVAYHLAHPERLSDDEVFEEAVELLVEVSEIRPAGDRHRQQIDALSQLVDVAGTPLAVVLLSDEVTEVTVYKVGRLGKFERHALNLRPGTYTVVGKRAGFRDVRHALVVKPGDAPEPLMVTCQDRI